MYSRAMPNFKFIHKWNHMHTHTPSTTRQMSQILPSCVSLAGQLHSETVVERVKRKPKTNKKSVERLRKQRRMPKIKSFLSTQFYTIYNSHFVWIGWNDAHVLGIFILVAILDLFSEFHHSSDESLDTFDERMTCKREIEPFMDGSALIFCTTRFFLFRHKVK